jgi:trimeric autotransporter adhesin
MKTTSILKNLPVLALFILNFSFGILSAQNINTIAGIGTVNGYSGDGGPATAAELYGPYHLTVDASDNIFIVDNFNSAIREVNHSTGNISTVAGIGTVHGYNGDGGPATAAELWFPYGVAVDDSGNIYIGDNGNSVIRKVVNSTGIISTIAGIGRTVGFYGDGGPATAAELYTPSGVVVDGSGNLYIADASNDVIREVNTSGIINTVAGIGDINKFSGDGGQATAAELDYPTGVALDGSGNLFIADAGNSVIREVGKSSGIINTVAGIGLVYGFSGDGGPATAADLNSPNSVVIDGSGNMFIGEVANYVVRKVDYSSGIISIVAGIGTVHGFYGDGGPATDAELYEPYGVALDNLGNLFISDTYNYVIREVGSVTTSVSKVNAASGVNLYPNPNNGEFNVVCNLSVIGGSQFKVDIYNVLGENVLTETLHSAQSNNLIDLTAQSSGVYFYKVVQADGSLLGEGKVEIEK